MIVPFTLLLGALGYFCYKSKDELTLLKQEKTNSQNEDIENDDLYSDLEDLFI